MGIDYKGVGGIGIKFTDEMVEEAAKSGNFDRQDWEDNQDKYLIYELGLECCPAGDIYNKIWYLFVEGKTFVEVNKNVPAFIDRLAKVGIIIKIDDIEVIADSYSY